MSEFVNGLRAWRDAGGVLVDLRDAEDYDAGHIPGAVHVPHEEARERVAGLAEDGAPVFLYCYSGNRAWMAEALLQAMGFDNVHAIGGIDRYTGELTDPV